MNKLVVITIISLASCAAYGAGGIPGFATSPASLAALPQEVVEIFETGDRAIKNKDVVIASIGFFLLGIAIILLGRSFLQIQKLKKELAAEREGMKALFSDQSHAIEMRLMEQIETLVACEAGKERAVIRQEFNRELKRMNGCINFVFGFLNMQHGKSDSALRDFLHSAIYFVEGSDEGSLKGMLGHLTTTMQSTCRGPKCPDDAEEILRLSRDLIRKLHKTTIAKRFDSLLQALTDEVKSLQDKVTAARSDGDLSDE